jgi:hypothetical protein
MKSVPGVQALVLPHIEGCLECRKATPFVPSAGWWTLHDMINDPGHMIREQMKGNECDDDVGEAAYVQAKL